MPTFVTLIELQPEHQAEAMQKVQERYEEAVALVESQGGEVKGTYYGDIAGYDALTITEFPDRESFDKADVLYSMDSSVKVDAFQVHPHDEFIELVGKALEES